MPEENDDAPRLTSLAAQLYARDVVAASAYFVDKLGFELDFVYGEPPFYAQVARDAARLTIRHIDEPIYLPSVRERDDLLSASITLATTDDVQRLFDAYRNAGARVHQPIRDEPWGARTFIIADLDDNLILFAGPSPA